MFRMEINFKTVKELENESNVEVVKQYYTKLFLIEPELKQKVREIYLKCKIADQIKFKNNGEFPINQSDPDYISNILYLSQEEYQENYALLTEQDLYSKNLIQLVNVMKKRKLL